MLFSIQLKLRVLAAFFGYIRVRWHGKPISQNMANNNINDAASTVERRLSETHIYIMYLTPTELAFLFYSIILTNPIVAYMSQAKLRRESNPKLGQRFPLLVAIQVPAPLNSRCNVAQNDVYKPALCQKKARFSWCWVHYLIMHSKRLLSEHDFYRIS